MPTYAFTRTREQVRSLVLRKLGELAVGEPPSADSVAVVDEAMDLRLKEMHAMGTLWWRVSNATTDVSLTAGVATAAVPAAMLFPVTMYLRVGSDDNPVDIVGHREFQAIQGKSESGEPSKVIVEGSNFRFWPVPQSNYTAKLTYQAIAEDTVDGSRPDVPVGALRAFAVLVAGDLVHDYGTPEPFASRLLAERESAMRVIRAVSSQRTDTTPVTPDYF